MYGSPTPSMFVPGQDQQQQAFFFSSSQQQPTTSSSSSSSAALITPAIQLIQASASCGMSTPIAIIPDEGDRDLQKHFKREDSSSPINYNKALPLSGKSRMVMRRGSFESELDPPTDLTTGIQQRRRRSAFIEDLSFQQMLECPGSRYSCIRVWTDARGRLFYDCSCGHRKAVQDLKKIQKHAERHQILFHECGICGKRFDRPLQLNAHKRVHRQTTSEVPAAVAEEENPANDSCEEVVVDSGVV
eukprot:TRINITY_DN1116_c0_g1_i1.p1 TRINITY_DN1116_c0_g1~~TRINITY_DN1116_c0_g1_i1.p1  ORF type:complete len:245 (+),score=41.13 TRINITY_DN1116_c0_g1_i1:367-1101(+)